MCCSHFPILQQLIMSNPVSELNSSDWEGFKVDSGLLAVPAHMTELLRERVALHIQSLVGDDCNVSQAVWNATARFTEFPEKVANLEVSGTLTCQCGQMPKLFSSYQYAITNRELRERTMQVYETRKVAENGTRAGQTMGQPRPGRAVVPIAAAGTRDYSYKPFSVTPSTVRCVSQGPASESARFGTTLNLPREYVKVPQDIGHALSQHTRFSPSCSCLKSASLRGAFPTAPKIPLGT